MFGRGNQVVLQRKARFGCYPSVFLWLVSELWLVWWVLVVGTREILNCMDLDVDPSVSLITLTTIARQERTKKPPSKRTDS